jgi:hypothetical protein
LTTRLERAFAVQGAGLPVAARTVLLVAAADDGGVLQEVLDAASVIEGTRETADALAPAVEARLVAVSRSRLVFRHPLVRSATYQAASPSHRRAAHAALAEVLADQPDRQVWHRAAATLGPDEQVAAELDEAAARAGRRGAARVAIDALTSAAELSMSPATRGGRLLRAAEMAFESGDSALGRQLLAAVEQLDLPAQDRTWLSWMREAYTEAAWSGTAKIESFVAKAERMRTSGHGDLAARSLLAIALRCYWGNVSQQTRSAVAAAAERLPLAGNEPTLLTILAWADPVQTGGAGERPAVPDDPGRCGPGWDVPARLGRNCGVGLGPVTGVSRCGHSWPARARPPRAPSRGSCLPGLGGGAPVPQTSGRICGRGILQSGPGDRSAAVGYRRAAGSGDRAAEQGNHDAAGALAREAEAVRRLRSSGRRTGRWPR